MSTREAVRVAREATDVLVELRARQGEVTRQRAEAVVYLREHGHTLQQIANALDLTHGRVSQILSQANTSK